MKSGIARRNPRSGSSNASDRHPWSDGPRPDARCSF